MNFINNEQSKKDSIELLKNIRVAICGNLPTACKTLRDIGISHIDKFDDGINACFKLRNGEEYHLILVYAPHGEGLDADMPYKVHHNNEWKSVPIKLLNEPACSSALIELETTVLSIGRKINKF